MLTKVLVPLDGTEVADSIIPYVSSLAQGLGMEVVFLSATDPNAIVLHVDDEETRLRNVSQILGNAENHLKIRQQAAISSLESAGVTAKGVITQGAPAEAILKVSQEEGCDLIAMSTQGRSVAGRGVLGSVTDKVVHSSDLPVMTILPDASRRAGDIEEVIVPLDGSALAEAVLPYVETLALKCGMRVVLIRAYQIGVTFMGDMPDAYIGLEGVEDDIRNEATRYLGQVAEPLKAKGIDVTTTILSGHPAQVLGEFAEDRANSMIAMCSHGHSGFSRWVLGSVAESTVRVSGDPVLIIPQR